MMVSHPFFHSAPRRSSIVRRARGLDQLLHERDDFTPMGIEIAQNMLIAGYVPSGYELIIED